MCVCVCLWWGWWDGNLSTIYLSLCWGSLLLVIYLRPYMLWHWSCVALAICLSIYPSIYLFCMYLHLPWRYYESSLSIHPRLSLSLFMYILVFLSMRWVLDPPILSIHILFYLLLTYSSSIRLIDLSIYQSISMPLTHICLYIGSACEYHGSTLHRSVCLSIYLGPYHRHSILGVLLSIYPSTYSGKTLRVIYLSIICLVGFAIWGDLPPSI